MTNRPKVIKVGAVTICVALIIGTASSMAAEITLAWDPHDLTHSGLIGYNLYYKENSSVQTDPDGSMMIYIPVTETDFDPDNPSYTVTGLQDYTEYYFTITAMVGDEESSMSNEVSAINGSSALVDTNPDTSSTSSGAGSGGGGCFINTLK
jgi:hypothetical protein